MRRTAWLLFAWMGLGFAARSANPDDFQRGKDAFHRAAWAEAESSFLQQFARSRAVLPRRNGWA